MNTKANEYKCLERQSDIIMFCQFVYQVKRELYRCYSMFEDIRHNGCENIFFKISKRENEFKCEMQCQKEFTGHLDNGVK